MHQPPGADHKKALPLVIALHGGRGRGKGMEILTGFNAVADREGFYVAYPDGVGRSWNDGHGLESFPAMKEDVDDVGFISAMIDELVAKLPADKSRVYATGIFNGGHMTNRLGVELSSRLAAIAPLAGTMPLEMAEKSRPERPLPVAHFHGNEDKHNYWGGGGLAGGKTISVAKLMQYWASDNGCSGDVVEQTLADTDKNDGTQVKRFVFGTCKTGPESVLLYEIVGGGHTWPGGFQYLPEEVIGRTSRDINASAVMWAFFKRFKRE